MARPIHVCILTTVHPIDDVRVNHKIGMAFRSAGFRVTWIGPNRVFFDAEKCNRSEIDFQLYALRPGKIGRLRSIMEARRRGRALKDVDVYYAPDPDSAWIVSQLSGRRKIRAIFDIHEIFHDVMLGRWLPGRLAAAAGIILLRRMKRLAMRCDLIIGVNRAVLEPYARLTTERMVVRSCAPAWFAKDPPSDVCAPSRSSFVLMHGKSNLTRGTATVLKALATAKNRVTGLKVLILDDFMEKVEGYGRNEFQRDVEDLGLADIVDFRSSVPMQEMPGMLRTCDAGMIAYDRRFGKDSLPNKLFEYMAAGLPIIAPSYATEIASVIRQEQCGRLVDFEDSTAVAEAIVDLRNHPEECRAMGRRARMAFEQRHNFEKESEPLLSRIRSWFPDRPRP